MRPQVPIERPKSRQNGLHPMNSQWSITAAGATTQRMRSETVDLASNQEKNRPKTLGTILASNHGVLNQISNLDDFMNNIDRFESVSMSSSADMARAQSQHTPRSGSSNNVDFSVLQTHESRLPPATRRHPQPANSRDSRENAPPQRPVVPAPRAVQYWEQQQQAEMSRRRTAFSQLEIHEMRSLPSNSLADDALLSPASVSGHQQATFRCHDVSNRGPRKSTKPKKQDEKKTPPFDVKTLPIQTNSILSYFSTNNLLRACTPSSPTSPVGQDATNTNKKSIWSYLDPNDDLYEYDDAKSPAASDSSDDEGYDSDKQATRERRSRRRKKLDSPKLPSKTQQDEALRQAYEDLMFISHKSPRNADKTYNRSSEKVRSTTPNTAGSRSSNTHTTTATTPDQDTADTSPTLSQIREDLWGNVSARPGTGRLTSTRVTEQSGILGDFAGNAQSTTISNSGAPFRTNAILSNINKSSAAGTIQPNNQEVGISSYRQAQQNPSRHVHDNEIFDPFGLEGQPRAQAQPRISQGREHVIHSHTDATPRVSNQFGLDAYNGSPGLHSQQFHPTPNLGNTNRRNTFAISTRDTKPRRTRPHSFGGSRQTAVPIESLPNNDVGNYGSLLTFPPDFYMLEALQKEIATGLQRHVGTPDFPPSNDDHVTIEVASRVDTQLSNLSGSEASAVGNELSKHEQRMEQVKQRSIRNYEILKQLEEEKHPQPTHVPGSTNSSARKKSSRGPRSGIPQHPNDTDGHYMYVAYSRFSEHARDVLQLCEHRTIPKPNAKSGQILVRILASSISPTDCDIRRGEWSSIQLNPYIIPGAAMVGVIHEAGSDSKGRKLLPSNFKVGDYVMALTKHGGNARFIAVSRNNLVRVPQHLDPHVVVCLTETYLTAFQALHAGQRGNTRYRTDSFRGKAVLVLGGSSCLGRALIEVAIAGGADYCYALSKERQFDAIQKIGGIPLPKDPQQWITLIGRQIDMLVTVTDSNGLYSDHLTLDHLKAINENGHVVFIGPPGVNSRSLNPFSDSSSPTPSKLICKSMKTTVMDRSFAFNVFDSWDSDPKLCKRDLEHLLELLEDHHLNPDILERVPLSKVAKVHSILETKKIPGFIVCSPWMTESQLVPRHQQQQQEQKQPQKQHNQYQQQQHQYNL